MADLPISFSRPMIHGLLREIKHPGTGKTQTRRIATPFAYDPSLRPGMKGYRPAPLNLWQMDHGGPYFLPRYSVGDRLYVREHWRVSSQWDKTAPRDLKPRSLTVAFEAGGSIANQDAPGDWRPVEWPGSPSVVPWMGRHRQGMHMPRWASRITLTVTDVRVQRLQEISETDAVAEGVPHIHEGNIGDEPYCSKCEGRGVHGAFGAGYGVAEVDCSECVTARQKFRNLWSSLHGPGAWEANPWVAAYTFLPILGNIDQIGKAA